MEARFCLRCGGPLAGAHDGERERATCANPGCGWVFYDNPLPVVAAIVEHEGAVLLARGAGWADGMFGLVTGFLERGETPEAGVVREVREELGLAAEIVSLVGVYAFEAKNELIVAFHVRAAGSVRLSPEIAELKRVAPERLRAWPFGTGLAVRDWIARRAAPVGTARTE
jgi:NADH pyrophosphatase NudC (nudix superfamily)